MSSELMRLLSVYRAVYNEALKRQNADLAGYLMDTHHVYSILPPSAARPPRGEEQSFLTTKFLENELMSQFVSTSRHC